MHPKQLKLPISRAELSAWFRENGFKPKKVFGHFCSDALAIHTHWDNGQSS